MGHFSARLAAVMAMSLAASASAGQGWTGITGGVGEDSRAAMMTRYADYNLHLVFADPGGSYLADVVVVIRDRSGHVIYRGPSTGPWLFLEVPPGTYRITARSGELRAERSAVAGDGQRGFTHLHLR
jgi:hypothetical protein